LIELKNITKRYNQLIAVDDVSLKIEERQRIVILGPSGCGKTTLLRLIAGFEEPDNGEIIIDESIVNNPKIKVSPQKRKIGMVFQDLALWPHMDVADNIGFGLESVFKHKAKIKEEIEVILRLVHLQDRSAAYPARLSGGEQQRVALARALIRRPEILLMDEPLVNLDFELKEKLMRLIMKLQLEFNITLVYVTHDEYMVKQLADKIVVMHQGRIEQLKNKDEVK